MIKKLLFIKNLGRFVNFSSQGDVEFQKLTLIFGENGRGKTMLSALFRSLDTGEPQYLVERKSVKSSTGPEVSVRVNSTNHTFKNGTWDAPVSGIMVFDTTFINENVYSGIYVDHDQKRNLYRFIVGDVGVQLATAVDEFDSKIRAKNEQIKTKEREIQPHTLGNLEVKKFVGLSLIESVDQQIIEKEAEIAALKQATDIANKSVLKKLSLPQVTLAEVEPLLSKKIEDIAKDAGTLIKRHIEACMDSAGELWINKGLAYIKGDRCPFCGQALAGQELIVAYQAFFSTTYTNLKVEIGQMIAKVATDFSQAAILLLQGTISSNVSYSEFWKGHVDGDYPSIEFDKLKELWSQLQSTVDRLLKRKEASPLEAITIAEADRQAFEAFASMTEAVSTYNAAVDAANVLIAAKKAKTAGGNLSLAESKLVELRNGQKRHANTIVKGLCDEYINLVTEKETLDTDKTKAKSDLDTHADQVLTKYEKRINVHLDNFGATFKICNTGTKYPGGKPTTDYQLSIDNTAVNLGDSKSASTGPSFRNTLSAGDKSTLAFAFFVARLEDDPNIAAKILVFDDPVSSLDSNRRHCTQQVIRSLAQKTKQVIVLSHDPQFLLSIWNEEKQSGVKNLQIMRSGQESTLSEWDIEIATRDAYLHNYFSLDEYIEQGTVATRDIARCIRPLLEANLRLRFPKEFNRKEWLGDFIDKIRKSVANSPLRMLLPALTELEQLNEFSKKFHHDQNPSGADSAHLDGAELQSYGRRTLRFVCGA